MSTIGLVLSIGVGIFMLWIVIILFPIYYENFKVSSHLRSFDRDNDLVAMDEEDMKKSLLRIYGVDDVDNVTAEDITIVKGVNDVIITVDYEVRSNVIGNVDVVVDFRNEKTYKL